MAEMKLIFTGPMGAGKTTAIRAISQIEPIATEVINTDRSEANKEETTVALDYGEVTLDSGEKLHLYGTPGQIRFEFMWQVLAQGALGVIVLMDNSRRDPLGDLKQYLEAFRALIPAGRVVVAIGRMDTHPQPSLDDYIDHLSAMGYFLPAMPADVRRREDVLAALELLFQQLEFADDPANTDFDDDWMQFVANARDARA